VSVKEDVRARYLSPREAGIYMSKSREAVRMMLRRGVLPHIKVGRSTYVDREDIDRLMQAHKVTMPD
jgi:excisionase family DNA binding protein